MINKNLTKATPDDTIVIFYHGEDFDGECAGAITYRYFLKIGIPKQQIKLIPVDYSYKLNLDSIKDKLVCILDYSFKPNEMHDIFQAAKELHWVDHHISAIEAYDMYMFDNDIFYEIPGKLTRYNTRSACELAWRYFFKGYKVPYTVRLLSRYDICGNPTDPDIDPMMFPFQYGLRIRDTHDVTSSLWYDIIFRSKSGIVEEICQDGIIAFKYDLVAKRKQIEAFGNVAILRKDDEILSDDVFLINIDKPGINVTYELRKKHEYVCVYMHNLKYGYRFSIYTSKHGRSAARIAARFGGGGHTPAAGFITTEFPFEIKKAD